MDPDRKIEKWLRAYAKKRRGQAGDSFKLDPATRRILQNEISGSAPSAEDNDDTMSLWELLRRHWLFFLGFAACIFVLASFFLPIGYKAKKKDLFSMSGRPASLDNLRQIPASTQGAVEKDEVPITNSAFETRAKSQPPVLLSDNVSVPPPRHAAAPLAMADTAGAPENAPPPVALASSSPISPPSGGLPTPALGNYAMAPTPVAESPQIPQSGGEQSDKVLTTRTCGLEVQNNFINTVAPQSQSMPVLANFQISQNGNTIRVVDHDGSVYTGTLQSEQLDADDMPESVATASAAGLASTASQNEKTPKVESPRMTESEKLAPAAPPTRGFGGGSPQFDNGFISAATARPVAPGAEGALLPDVNSMPSPQTYTFRVGGMNRTLKQSVVFTATLIENLESMKNAQVTFGMSANAAYGAALAQQAMKSEQTNHAPPLPWSSLHITGTAVINRTNQIEINATPVVPSGNHGSLK